MESPAKSITLDEDELGLIESHLTPSEVGQVGTDGFLPDNVPTRSFCLKIGSALAEAYNTKAPLEVALTQEECWILRERLSIYERIANRQNGGLLLKLKIYGLLQSFAAGFEDGPQVEEQLGAAEAKDRLREKTES